MSQPHRLADMLHLWLASRRLTLREAASQIGISHATLWRISEGRACDVPTWIKVQTWLLDSPSDGEKGPSR